MTAPHRRHQGGNDAGSGMIAGILVLTAMLLTAGAGTMVDGGRVLTARRHVSAIAFETARAGAQAVTVDGLRDGIVEFDPAAVDGAARAAFASLAAGTNAELTSVSVTGTDVAVTVTQHVNPFFALIGPSTVTVTGRARIVPSG